MSLRFGVQLFPYHRVDRNPTVQFEEDIDLIQHLDRLGYDEVWIGEHHSTGWQNIAAPELMIAAAARVTQNIRFGTGVSSLPYHHPFQLLDRIILLDHLVKGRFIWGVGAGSLALDARMIGVEPLEQRRMTEESLEAITALLAFDGKVTRKTDWFELNDAELHLAPYNGSLDIRVASQRSPSGPLLAGRFGTGLHQFGVMGTDGDNPLKTTWGIAEESAERHGTTVSRDKWSALHLMHIAETEEQAREEARWGLEAFARYMSGILPLSKTDPAQHDALIDELNGAAFVIGTPQMAIERIEKIVEMSGGLGAILIGNTEIGSPEATKKSFQLIADHVIPHFNGQLTPRMKSVDTLNHYGKSGDQLLAAHAKAQEQYDASKAPTA